MIHFLPTRGTSSLLPAPPQRRRVIIVGAGAAGLSAAFHIGEHSLLLDRRQDLEVTHDSSNDFAMGTAGGRSLGAEDCDSDGQRPGVSVPERKALFISCSSQTAAQDSSLIHVTRWQPPALTPPSTQWVAPFKQESSYRTLVPLLRGELRFDAWVVRVNASQRLLELASGEQFVYDKLFCTQSLAAIAGLVLHELPGRVRTDEGLRYWLQDQDIEVADQAARTTQGDIDEFAAGRRVAALISQALAAKFRSRGQSAPSSARLFEPRLVSPLPVDQAGLS